jgi:hypothetical protein
MKTKLPVSVWGHAILHAGALIRIRPSADYKFSPSQLVFGKEPDISHLRIFGCAVYVPIAPPQRTKMGPQKRLEIYIGFESPSIIKYLEPFVTPQIPIMTSPSRDLRRYGIRSKTTDMCQGRIFQIQLKHV